MYNDVYLSLDSPSSSSYMSSNSVGVMGPMTPLRIHSRSRKLLLIRLNYLVTPTLKSILSIKNKWKFCIPFERCATFCAQDLLEPLGASWDPETSQMPPICFQIHMEVGH